MEIGAKELSPRHHALLLAAVQEFIDRAEPVGSQQLALRYSLGVRAAMVRSMMSELEEAGYLLQPHTSAGRIPTDRAFRYFVDHLAPAIPFRDRAQIELHYSAPASDVGSRIRETSRLLALMTGQAALVTAPRLESITLEQVRFVRLRHRQILVVLIAAAGGAENRLLTIEQDHSQAELDRMAAYLNESISGRTLEEAREWIADSLRADRANYDRFVRTALVLAGAVTQTLTAAEVYVEGSIKAIEQPEFADHLKLRELLKALEDKTALLDLLDRTLTSEGPVISIGSENSDLRLSGFSVIAAAYASGSQPLGSLAIVGPVRMDYERVIALVSYTAKALSRALDQ
jgi:heat-inducible transcriptional repressor